VTKASLSLFERLRQPARLSRRDLWLTFIPMVLWIAALYSRPFLIHPSCVQVVTAGAVSGCEIANVPAIDRPGVGNLNGDADFYSYAIQNTTGVLAAFGPGIYQGALVGFGVAIPAVALNAFAIDTLIFAQTWFFNGFLNESARLVAGRARPYLYSDSARGQTVDPLLLIDPQNYTSFYSGHTSFVTAVCVFLLLTLLGRGAGAGLLITVGIFSECLIFSTGVFRILAGRHFLTDVLVAIVMGTLSALFVAVIHRSKTRGLAL
jgi:membrane-associated phospholipid phosphatase